MRIIRLQVENVKRLQAVDITPDGDLVVIAGPNGAGKTSVLDAIWLALGGAAAARGMPRPVRDGASRAKVTLDLGPMTVTRTWTADGKTSLKVESKDGARYSSPQTMLDALIGDLAFDPLAFAGQSEKDQIQSLISVIDLPFDPAALDAERRELYEQRTIQGRRVTELKGQLAGMPEIVDVPKPVSTRELVDAMQQANDALVKRRRIERDRDGCIEELESLDREKASLRERVEWIEGEQVKLRENLASNERALEGPEPDPSQFSVQLIEAEKTNALIREAEEREKVAAQLQAQTAVVDELTAKIEQLDATRRDGVAAAKMPVDGLGFSDEGVTYRGVPFTQCSTSEQLRVSVAMAMALNPKLRIIRITDGSLLDSQNLALVAEMASAHDYQIWVERVDESGQVGIYIEDGAVQS